MHCVRDDSLAAIRKIVGEEAIMSSRMELPWREGVSFGCQVRVGRTLNVTCCYEERGLHVLEQAM